MCMPCTRGIRGIITQQFVDEMLSNNTFLETRIQWLLNRWFDLGRTRTGRARAAHTLELSRCLYIDGKLRYFFEKKTKGNSGPKLDHDLTIWCQLIFFIKINSAITACTSHGFTNKC